MIKRKNKFLTFVFSLLPGGGQMFMGFMKRGVSLMAAFFFTIFLSSWLDIGPLMFIVPVIWFYAFFDSINRCYADDAAFAAMEDGYLFSPGRFMRSGRAFPAQLRLAAGALFVLVGGYTLWNSFMRNLLWRLLPSGLYNAVEAVSGAAPKFVLGVLILAIGVWLIVGRKKGDDGNV